MVALLQQFSIFPMMVASFILGSSTLSFAGPSKVDSTKANSVRARNPQSVNAAGSTSSSSVENLSKCKEKDGVCYCRELSAASAHCASLLETLRREKRRDVAALRSCYIQLIQRRYEVVSHGTHPPCDFTDRVSAQIEILHGKLDLADSQDNDLKVTETRGLQGFGVELFGRLGKANQRTPAKAP